MAKSKTKIQNKKHQTIEFAPVIEAEEEPDVYPIVRIKSYEMKPMSVQDAILNMNNLGHSFYTFLNEESGKFSTVYRRNEEDYGMIEPI